MTTTAAKEEKRKNRAENMPATNQETTTIKVTPEMATARRIVDIVAARTRQYIESGELLMPDDYDVNGAIKAAYLALQEVTDKDKVPALRVCTESSIANALLDMIVQGLNPRKKQCAFVVFGRTLVCMREYFGSMAIAERVDPRIKDWGCKVVYADDELEYDIVNGKYQNLRHHQSNKNIQKDKIVGAYAMALDQNGDPLFTEYLTWDQILQAWKQSPAKPFDDKGSLKPDSVHAKFPADMAQRTAINKVCKFIVNRSSDKHLTALKERLNRMQELADEAMVNEEISKNANKGEVLEIPEIGLPTIEHEPEGEAVKPDPDTKVKCPQHGKAVSVADCDTKCDMRKGCPAHENPETEESQEAKKSGRMPGF